MIPKIIHYCWFGSEGIPPKLQKCIASWKQIMPEYQLVQWDEKSFDINSLPWTKEAYEQRKFAFVSDYVRLFALNKIGGIYLDTDVLVKKSFDPLLCLHGFMGFENDVVLSSAIMGFEAGHPILGKFLSHYENKHFVTQDGNLEDTPNVQMMTATLQKHGLVIEDRSQLVENICIFPREYFCPLDFYYNDHSSENTFCVHMFEASWLSTKKKKRLWLERSKKYKAYLSTKHFIKTILESLYEHPKHT